MFAGAPGGGRRFDALVLHFPSGPEYAIGLSGKVSPAQVEALVKSHAVDIHNYLA